MPLSRVRLPRLSLKIKKEGPNIIETIFRDHDVPAATSPPRGPAETPYTMTDLFIRLYVTHLKVGLTGSLVPGTSRLPPPIGVIPELTRTPTSRQAETQWERGTTHRDLRET
jgi:hypothetical protein